MYLHTEINRENLIKDLAFVFNRHGLDTLLDKQDSDLANDCAEWLDSVWRRYCRDNLEKFFPKNHTEQKGKK